MKTIKRPHLAGMSCFPSERVVKVVVLKKEMVLSTTFALAQRHERRGMNEINKMTSSRWDEFLSRLKARTIASRTLSLLNTSVAIINNAFYIT